MHALLHWFHSLHTLYGYTSVSHLFLLPLLQVCSMLSSVSWRDFLRGKSLIPLIRKSPLNKSERLLVFVFPEETAFSLPSRESFSLLLACVDVLSWLGTSTFWCLHFNFQFDNRKYCEHDFHVLFAPCCGKCGKLLLWIFSYHCSCRTRRLLQIILQICVNWCAYGELKMCLCERERERERRLKDWESEVNRAEISFDARSWPAVYLPTSPSLGGCWNAREDLPSYLNFKERKCQIADFHNVFLCGDIDASKNQIEREPMYEVSVCLNYLWHRGRHCWLLFMTTKGILSWSKPTVHCVPFAVRSDSALQNSCVEKQHQNSKTPKYLPRLEDTCFCWFCDSPLTS